MDKMDEMIKKLENLIDEKDTLINKLTENVTIKHKQILKYKNRSFNLCKKLSELKICPLNLGIEIKINEKKCRICKNLDIKIILDCYREYINAD